MNMFLAAGAVIAAIIIAAAFVYVPQLSDAGSGSSNMPVIGGTEQVNETVVEETAQDIQAPAETENEAPSVTEPLAEAPTDSRPDLEIVGIKLDPVTPLVNELITFTASIRNSGGSDVESFSFTLSPLIDQVSIISAASAESSFLAPGGTTSIRLQAKIAVPGPAKVKSTVDTFNSIKESNETNNQLVVPFRIYTKQNWAGCSGNGKSVCADLVDSSYFDTNKECRPAYNCTSFITGCDAVCPFPR